MEVTQDNLLKKEVIKKKWDQTRNKGVKRHETKDALQAFVKTKYQAASKDKRKERSRTQVKHATP